MIEKLATDRRYGPYFRSIIVRSRDHNGIGTGLTWERDLSGALVMTQQPVQQWRNVLQGLNNCRSIGFYGGGHGRPQELLGSLMFGDAVTMTLTIAVELQRKLIDITIRDFTGVPGANWDSDDPELRSLSRTPLHLPGFALVCSTLKSLTLGCRIGEPEDPAHFIIHLLSHAVCLEELSINGHHGFGSPAVLMRLFVPESQFRLKRLKLSCALAADAEYLRIFLARHRRTLKSLSLMHLHVEEGGWLPTIRSLVDQFPVLEDVELGYLCEGEPWNRWYVEYPGIRTDDSAWKMLIDGLICCHRQPRAEDAASRIQYVSYNGARIDVALRKFAAIAVIGEPFDL
ncbi:hypothetical protein BDW62DRAFT_203726 [Aspergillus aurantiobrunneus]